MAKKSRHSKDPQASNTKGGKLGKGALVLDLSDPVDEAFDLVRDQLKMKISNLFFGKESHLFI